MEAREFHKLASALLADPKPAQIRTAISRAYYAVFNLAVEFLTGLGFGLPKYNKHVAVQHRLQNCGDSEIERVGSELTELASKRSQADYDLDDKSIESGKTALIAVAQADRMMQAVEKCLTNKSRQRVITSAIEKWEISTGNRPASS
jgi:uncharacterized protein (UPF0332 family)